MAVGGASGAATPVRMSRSNKEFFYRLRRFRRLVAEREQPELPISAVAVLERSRADELSARCANLEFCMWSLLERVGTLETSTSSSVSVEKSAAAVRLPTPREQEPPPTPDEPTPDDADAGDDAGEDAGDADGADARDDDERAGAAANAGRAFANADGERVGSGPNANAANVGSNAEGANAGNNAEGADASANIKGADASADTEGSDAGINPDGAGAGTACFPAAPSRHLRGSRGRFSIAYTSSPACLARFATSQGVRCAASCRHRDAAALQCVCGARIRCEFHSTGGPRGGEEKG